MRHLFWDFLSFSLCLALALVCVCVCLTHVSVTDANYGLIACNLFATFGHCIIEMRLVCAFNYIVLFYWMAVCHQLPATPDAKGRRAAAGRNGERSNACTKNINKTISQYRHRNRWTKDKSKNHGHRFAMKVKRVQFIAGDHVECTEFLGLPYRHLGDDQFEYSILQFSCFSLCVCVFGCVYQTKKTTRTTTELDTFPSLVFRSHSQLTGHVHTNANTKALRDWCCPNLSRSMKIDFKIKYFSLVLATATVTTTQIVLQKRRRIVSLF